MSETYKEIEVRVLEALKTAQNSDNPNLSKIARDHNVPYQRLFRRFKGAKSKFTRAPTNRKLNPVQENAIIRSVKESEAMGASLRINGIVRTANLVLNDVEPMDIITGQLTNVTQQVGQNWTKRFVDRRPELRTVTQKPMEIARARAEDPIEISMFYDRLAEDILGVPPTDIWNMDESGFQVGSGGSRKVVTSKVDKPRHYIASQGSRESVTVVEAISAAGDVIDPFIVVSGKILQAQHFRNELGVDTILATSESGFVNDQLLIQWLMHFNKLSKVSQRGIRRVLIWDNQVCHHSKAIIEYAAAVNITLIFLPPHTTHFLQPLDVAVFQQYKHFHRKKVNEAADLGWTKFNKTSFLTGLAEVRKDTFKPNTIRAGFRMTGIYPLNPSVVLKWLEENGNQDDDDGNEGLAVIGEDVGGLAQGEGTSAGHGNTLLTTPVRPVPTTPHSLREMLNMSDYLKENGFRDTSPTPEKFLKGAMEQHHCYRILELNNHWRTLYSKEEEARRRNGRKQIERDGIIDMETGRNIDDRLLLETMEKENKREWKKQKESNREINRGPWGDVVRHMMDCCAKNKNEGVVKTVTRKKRAAIR